jgi:hypothetical protein
MPAQFRDVLSPQERLAAWRLGAYMKFASIGVQPSRIDAYMQKHAAGATTSAFLSPVGMAKTIATVAILTGVPLGVAAHIVGNRIKNSRGREAELQAQTGYYRNAAQQLENSLAAADTAT